MKLIAKQNITVDGTLVKEGEVFDIEGANYRFFVKANMAESVPADTVCFSDRRFRSDDELAPISFPLPPVVDRRRAENRRLNPCEEMRPIEAR